MRLCPRRLKRPALRLGLRHLSHGAVSPCFGFARLPIGVALLGVVQTCLLVALPPVAAQETCARIRAEQTLNLSPLLLPQDRRSRD